MTAAYRCFEQERACLLHHLLRDVASSFADDQDAVVASYDYAKPSITSDKNGECKYWLTQKTLKETYGDKYRNFFSFVFLADYIINCK